MAEPVAVEWSSVGSRSRRWATSTRTTWTYAVLGGVFMVVGFARGLLAVRDHDVPGGLVGVSWVLMGALWLVPRVQWIRRARAAGEPQVAAQASAHAFVLGDDEVVFPGAAGRVSVRWPREGTTAWITPGAWGSVCFVRDDESPRRFPITNLEMDASALGALLAGRGWLPAR